MTLKLLNSTRFTRKIWIGTDLEETYKKNLEVQPIDWRWRTEKLTYTYNSQSYRAPEWCDIDWNNSVVVFGCSQVFGVGVSDDQTSSHYLSRLLNMPVINLGIPGGSIMSSWINTEKLLDYGIKPAAVIYYWPSANRTVELIDNEENINAGSWILDLKDKKYGKEWVTHPTHGLEYAKYAVMSIKRSWSCPQLHYSWDKTTAKFLSIPWNIKTVDYARDCLHSGPQTWKNVANDWYYHIFPKIAYEKHNKHKIRN